MDGSIMASGVVSGLPLSDEALLRMAELMASVSMTS
jgi:hypothetical protein